MDLDLVEFAIKNHNIKAILLVHNGGYPADMISFNFLAKKYNIPIIEDCAHAFGATSHGKNIGQTDNICVWSFQAVKNLCVGDGGGISTTNEEYYKRINTLRWLGIDRDTVSRSSGGYNWKYDVAEIGFKYHMCDIIAAVGIVQLRHVVNDNARRKEIAEMYYNKLKNITLPKYNRNRESSYWFAPIFVENQTATYNKLVENQIFPSIHFMNNANYKMFKDYVKINNCEHANWYQNHVLSLPIHLYMTNEEVDKIINIVNSI